MIRGETLEVDLCSLIALGPHFSNFFKETYNYAQSVNNNGDFKTLLIYSLFNN